MGLFSTTRINHIHKGDTINNFPDRIDVHEHKAPTDESIRLMEEMHHKAISNIIAKVKVEDNLVNGECYAVHQLTNINDIKLFFRFKINGQEFQIEQEINSQELRMGTEWKDIREIESVCSDYLKAIMLFFTLKKFVQVAYQKITNQPFPDHLIK